MAFVVNTVLDNFRNYVISVTGTGADAAGVLVNVSTLDPACSRMRLKRIAYDIAPAAGVVTLFWDATVPTTLLNLSSGPGQGMDFCQFGGIPNNGGAGTTGNVLITTPALTVYTLVLEFVKSDPVNKL